MEARFLQTELEATLKQKVFLDSDDLRDLRQLMAFARQHPGQLTLANAGEGSPHHICAGLFAREAGASVTHVPYKGAAPAITDLLGGSVQALCDNVGTIRPFIESRKVRPLAVSTRARTSLLPEVPTFAEAGLADFESYSWQGLAAPAGTPEPIVARLNAELNKALASDDIRKRLADLGIEPSPTTPAEFTAFVKAQSALWGEVIRAANIKLEQ